MIISLISGFIIGVAVGSFFHITLVWFLVLGLLEVIFFVYRYFIEESYRQVLVILTIFLLGFIIGTGRVTLSDLYSGSQLDTFADKRIFAEGIVVGEPDVRETNTKLIVHLQEVNFDSATTSVNEKVLVTVPLYPEFHYGDKVAMELTLQEPKNIESESGRIFDYNGYLRVREIWYTSTFVKIKLLSSGSGAYIKDILFQIKHSFTSALNKALPEPQSSLMSGLLLGSKQSLGKDLLAEFSKTGVSHIVVLSGYNIAIVATSIMSILSFLPKNLSFGFGILSIVLFTILSGGGASAWRAAIMVLVALFAKKYNRDFKAGRAFGFTIVVMLAPNPLLLIFDPSFQLSVLATIGIIFVSPIISPFLSRVTEKYGLREIISTTLATQITVLPLLIYNTGLFSLVSLPVNVLILGSIPTTMFLGFITGIVGLVSLWLSFIPAFFTYALLWYQLTIVHIGANLPFGTLNLPVFSPIILVLIYGILFTILYFLKKKVNT